MGKIASTKIFHLEPRTLNLKPYCIGRGAFTLVEVLIVVAVTALLSSFLLVYNNNSRKQIALFVEQAKIAQIITKAKSQAISTYAAGDVKTCGYGVQFNYEQGSYDIFRYEYDRDCDTLTRASAVFDDFHVKPVEGLHFTLNQALVFDDSHEDGVSYVLFVAPDPRTIIRIGDVSRSSGSVYVKSKNSQESAKVTIGSAGQINY